MLPKRCIDSPELVERHRKNLDTVTLDPEVVRGSYLNCAGVLDPVPKLPIQEPVGTCTSDT
jgi:hypothetical protein